MNILILRNSEVHEVTETTGDYYISEIISYQGYNFMELPDSSLALLGPSGEQIVRVSNSNNKSIQVKINMMNLVDQLMSSKDVQVDD